MAEETLSQASHPPVEILAHKTNLSRQVNYGQVTIMVALLFPCNYRTFEYFCFTVLNVITVQSLRLKQKASFGSSDSRLRSLVFFVISRESNYPPGLRADAPDPNRSGQFGDIALPYPGWYVQAWLVRRIHSLHFAGN